MRAELRLIPCLSDNYAVLMHDPSTNATAVIDAPEAQPILDALEREGWTLTHILVTHHHDDHIAGIPALMDRYEPEVIAPAANKDVLPGATRHVKQGDLVNVGALHARVEETPGHTLGHVSFVFEEDRLLFAGDTMFAMGCGRLLEGTPEQMWTSLHKLRQLPADTKVYCGHEYTLSNGRFALAVDPENIKLKARMAEVERLREEKRPTIPFTLAEEKATNPFLRADDPEFSEKLGFPLGTNPVEVFAELRRRKDVFR